MGATEKENLKRRKEVGPSCFKVQCDVLFSLKLDIGMSRVKGYRMEGKRIRID